MNLSRQLFIPTAILLGCLTINAQVPQLINYQGRVTVGGTNFDGTGKFKFALVNATGSTNYWSNDGVTSGQPVTTVSITVSKGLYSVLLGDTNVVGMSAGVPALIFTNSDVRLRAWFSDGTGFQQLTPDQRIAAVGFAFVAAGVDPTSDIRAQRLNIGSGNALSGSNSAIAGGLANSITGSYAFIGGGLTNAAGGFGAAVAGGESNLASGSLAFVGGGYANLASATGAVVVGGSMNGAAGTNSFVGGGYGNLATNTDATIAGGEYNGAYAVASSVGGGYGNLASGYAATIPGGYGNSASASYSFIGGGLTNGASGVGGVVAGGEANGARGTMAFVGGGYANLASAIEAVVGGGAQNAASGTNSFVGGGYGNLATNTEATVAGGEYNGAYGITSSVGGGYGNLASGYAATIPGGYGNVASGSYSFAAGAGASATHYGAFVLADASSTSVFSSTSNNEFAVRSAGGIRFFANSAATVGVRLATGGNAWSATSDRNLKENFRPVDGRAILAKVVATPVTEWNLISQDPAIRHIGPMAQDFKTAFGVGEDDRHISTTDADGVAFAAIQGLYQEVKERDARIAELEKRLNDLEAQMQHLPVPPERVSAFRNK